jgi:DNA polymerase elongation subunit (family B)
MATLIVDIETKGEVWSDLPGITRAALTHWIDKGNFTPEEKRQKQAEVIARLALSPFTASIISLAIYDVERKTGAVYFVSNSREENFTADSFTFKQRTEKEILEDFWEGALSYDSFVTFNGRSFVMPFLYHRSIVQKVKPTVEIAKERYLSKQTLPYHIDLLDEFSLHGGLQHRPSLQLLCGAYGIQNASILGGEEIDTAFTEGQFRTIAEKSMGDVQVINELYEKWKYNLAPRAFLNVVE